MIYLTARFSDLLNQYETYLVSLTRSMYDDDYFHKIPELHIDLASVKTNKQSFGFPKNEVESVTEKNGYVRKIVEVSIHDALMARVVAWYLYVK